MTVRSATRFSPFAAIAMLRVLLVMGHIGCAGEAAFSDDATGSASSGSRATNTRSVSSVVKNDGQASAKVSRAALAKLGAKVKRNADGKIVDIQINNANFKDVDLAHLEGMSALQRLAVVADFTDAGLVHLKGLTSLQMLSLDKTQGYRRRRQRIAEGVARLHDHALSPAAPRRTEVVGTTYWKLPGTVPDARSRIPGRLRMQSGGITT